MAANLAAPGKTTFFLAKTYNIVRVFARFPMG
jgi:hypothetical protein